MASKQFKAKHGLSVGDHDIIDVDGNIVLPTSATITTTGGAIASYNDLSDLPDLSSVVNDADYVHTDNNYTTTEKTKLANIEANATADQTASEILTAVKTVDGASSGLDADLLDGQHGYYYISYTDTAIANLVDSSPAALNTLNELASALGDDPNFATTVTNSIATKVGKDSDVGAAYIPAGTTAQQPTGVAGMFRFNTDNATFEGYNGTAWAGIAGGGEVSMYSYEYIATSGQTVFSGVDVDGNTLAYTAGNIRVYLNGIQLSVAEYTATDGTSVTLTVGATLNDEVVIVAFESFAVADTYTRSETDSLLSAKQTEIDTIETNTGLGTDGSYTVPLTNVPQPIVPYADGYYGWIAFMGFFGFANNTHRNDIYVYAGTYTVVANDGSQDLTAVFTVPTDQYVGVFGFYGPDLTGTPLDGVSVDHIVSITKEETASYIVGASSLSDATAKLDANLYLANVDLAVAKDAAGIGTDGLYSSPMVDVPQPYGDYGNGTAGWLVDSGNTFFANPSSTDTYVYAGTYTISVWDEFYNNTIEAVIVVDTNQFVAAFTGMYMPDYTGTPLEGVTAGSVNWVTKEENPTYILGASSLNAAAATLDYNLAATAAALDGKQPLDGDLTAIAGLTGTSGLLKKTAADTWTLDTTSYQAASTAITTSNIGSQSVNYATSAGNADLLDGQHGSYYNHRSYTDSTNYLGGYYVSGGSEKPNNTIFGAGKLKIAMLSGSNLGFAGSWNDVLWISTYTGGDVKPSWAIVGDKYSDNMYIARQNYDSASWGTGHKLWHSGNDGSGSGLDADLLDSLHASSFLRSDTSTTNNTDIRAPIFYDSNDTSYYLDANSTSTSLKIAGTIEQGENYAHPNVEWAVSGNTTGEVIFYLPGTTGNYGMVHMVFDIYEYNSLRHCTVEVSGHNWSTAWYNYGANVVGYTDKSVRLGVKDGRFVVVFGNTGSSWTYGTIRLRKIHNGGFYPNSMDLGGNWSTTLTTTESFSWISGDLRELRTSSTMYSYAYRGHSNVAGTGEASYHPVGIYSTGTNWLYGTIITNNNNVDAGTGTVTSGRTYGTTDIRAPIFYDSDNTAYYVSPNGTNRLYYVLADSIYSYGNITAYSDERLKEDWALLPDNFVEKLAEVKHGTYTRIDTKERQLGVGAQSLQKILPEAVSDKEGYLGVTYGNAAMVSAVELAKELIKQKREIEELKALVTSLLAK